MILPPLAGDFFEKKQIQEDVITKILSKEILQDHDILDIQEFLQDYQLYVGFDDDYNLNKEGKILEEMIDKFLFRNFN